MTIFLDKIDSAPINSDELSFQLNSWIAVLVDTLNEVIGDIENSFNILQAQSYTSAEIAALNVSPDSLPNGVILYDSTLNLYVGKQSGSLVKFTTSPYP